MAQAEGLPEGESTMNRRCTVCGFIAGPNQGIACSNARDCSFEAYEPAVTLLGLDVGEDDVTYNRGDNVVSMLPYKIAKLAKYIP